MRQVFESFGSFYPFYLSEHRHPMCRRLHFVGTSLVVLLISYALATESWRVLWLLPLVGYGFAWVGHFVFEKNRPATFQYPFYSLLGDFRMFYDVLTGRLGF